MLKILKNAINVVAIVQMWAILSTFAKYLKKSLKYIY